MLLDHFMSLDKVNKIVAKGTYKALKGLDMVKERQDVIDRLTVRDYII